MAVGGGIATPCPEDVFALFDSALALLEPLPLEPLPLEPLPLAPEEPEQDASSSVAATAASSRRSAET